MKCKHCQREAEGFTIPPLCEAHQDLAVMIDYLNDNNEPVTVENVQALVEKCQGNGGDLTITPEDVPALMADEYAEAYRMKSVA